MTVFIDAEFGEVTVQKRRGSRGVRIKVATNGRLVATAPLYTPLIFIKQVVQASRDELRSLLKQSGQSDLYAHGQPIGKQHTLAIVPTTMVKKPSTKVQRDTLLVYLPPDSMVDSQEVQQLIRDTVVTILRQEAKSYLPQRLKQLAHAHDFRYERTRLSHAAGRWGSCSSTGTISLNIALMKLPDELIDYVMIHELCHTRHMNHSTQFWQEVERYDPHYRVHKRQVKRFTPSV